MRLLQYAALGLIFFSLSGCAHSRLRKDFVGMFKSDWPQRQSPFAQKCDNAGKSLASGVDKAAAKLDGQPLKEGSQKAKEGVDQTAGSAKEKFDETKDKAAKKWDILKTW